MADDLETLIRCALEWHRAGHDLAIATVTNTWGSAPRPRGAHMIIRDDGQFLGSISGGCVEGDVLAQAQDVIRLNKSRHRTYGVDDDAAWAVSLPCGGQISVLLQPVSDAGYPVALLELLLAERATGKSLTVATDIAAGTSAVGSEGSFVQRYEPPLRLAIIGAAHIAQYLIPMAQTLGHDVLLIDPRSAFANAERFPGVTIDDRWPDEALAAWKPDAASAVITLSHDPKIDDPALLGAIASPAYYVGALGSRRSHAARLERLAKAGATPEQLAAIHGPVGIAINALTPDEIAVSILAGLVEARRRKP